MASKKKIALIVTGVVVIAAVFGAVVWQGKKTSNDGKPVKMAELTEESLTTSIFTNGKVVGNDKRLVNAEVTGKVAELLAKEGDWVEVGTPVVRLDAAELEDSLRTQEIQLAVDQETLNDLRTSGTAKSDIGLRNAEILMNDAKKAYDDKVALFESGAVSQSEVDQAKSSYERAKNDYDTYKYSGTKSQIRVQELRVKSTQVAIDKLKKDIDKTIIKAPISGTVTSMDLKAGDRVVTGAEVMTIEDTKNLKVETNISEYDAYKVKIGQKVEVKAEGINKNYMGTVEKIASAAMTVTTGQSSETIVKTEVRILDKDTVLKPNFTVKLTINTASSENALALPYEAIFTKKDGTKIALFVDKDSKIIEKKLELGVEGDMEVQLLNKDVKKGDKVILNPTEDLKTGDKVKSIEGGKK